MTAERFPVETGHIMMFARAVGDDSPIYGDPDDPASIEAGGIMAPPTFVQASAQFDPDYFLRPKNGEPWLGSGAEASGVDRSGDGGGGSGLHAEQHFTYHRPLHAGTVLHATTSEGKTWEKHSERSGKLTFRESITEYRDDAGELIVTARGVGVKTEKVVS
ncbi:MAG: MaoC family dehydratase N-terminal domain-containing protein [Actinomycetota bacterium]|nr:MaoC family dehydratase N-terminal domain-containing protein [Actinomycetota bacterium]